MAAIGVPSESQQKGPRGVKKQKERGGESWPVSYHTQDRAFDRYVLFCMYTYMPPRRQEQAIIRRFGCFPPGKDALYSMDISAGYMIMEHAPPRFSSGLVSGFEGAGSVNRVLAFFRLATLAVRDSTLQGGCRRERWHYS